MNIPIPTSGFHAPGEIAPAPAVEHRPAARGGDVYVHGRLFGWYHTVGAGWAVYVPGRGLRRVSGPEAARALLLDLAAVEAGR